MNILIYTFYFNHIERLTPIPTTVPPENIGRNNAWWLIIGSRSNVEWGDRRQKFSSYPSGIRAPLSTALAGVYTGWVKKNGISNQKPVWKSWCCESCLTCLPLPTGPYLTLLGLTGPHWALLGLTGPHWALLGLTGPYWALLGLTGPYWALLGLTGPYWATFWICAHTNKLTN